MSEKPLFASPADIARQSHHAERYAEDLPEDGNGEGKKGVTWAPELESAPGRERVSAEMRGRERRGGDDSKKGRKVNTGEGTSSRKERKMPSTDTPLVRTLLMLPVVICF